MFIYLSVDFKILFLRTPSFTHFFHFLTKFISIEGCTVTNILKQMNIIPVVYSVELLCLLMSMPREEGNVPYVNRLLSSKAVRIKKTSYLSHVVLLHLHGCHMKFQIQVVCGKIILVGCMIVNIYHPCIYKSYAFYNIHF